MKIIIKYNNDRNFCNFVKLIIYKEKKRIEYKELVKPTIYTKDKPIKEYARYMKIYIRNSIHRK